MLHRTEDVTGRKSIVDQTSMVLHIPGCLLSILFIVYIFFFFGSDWKILWALVLILSH